MSFLILLAVTTGDIWIWKIFSYNFVIGLATFASTSLLYFYTIKKNTLFLLGFLSILILGIFFVNGFHASQLTQSPQEALLSQQRLNEYPHITWAPVAHWLEERKETITFYKLMDNLSIVLNPNLYFFANHPRERPVFDEIEKFPYVLLPFFLLGTFMFVSEKKLAFYIIALIFPVINYSIFGSAGKIDPYLFFPFLSVSIAKGISILNKKCLVFVGVLWLLILVQSFIYAKY